MASPTMPTLANLVSEALKKAGYTTPSATLTTRAQTYWMEEVKNDIWNKCKTLDSLICTSILVLSNGVWRYPLPTDFSSIMSMTLIDGTTIGTAQAGASTTITLASTDTNDENALLGKEILIYAGTGAGSIAQVSAYNSTTKVATVSPGFNTAPASGSSYEIIDSVYELHSRPVWDIDKIGINPLRERPETYHIFGNSSDGEFLFYPIPYRTDGKKWAARCRYFADLMEVDLGSALMTTLYKRWRNIFIQGVFVRTLQDTKSDATDTEMKKYYNMLEILVGRESYGMDLSKLTACIEA